MIEDDELRRAFAERPGGEPSDDPQLAEQLWAVATGALTGPPAQALVERCARDPAVAELWRITFELARRSGQGVEAPPLRVVAEAEVEPEPDRARTSWVWLGAAVMAAAAAVLLLRTPSPSRPEVDPVMRARQPEQLRALTPDGSTLPRGQFVLRWDGAPEGSHYEVRLETEALLPVVVAPDLASTSLRVETKQLAQYPEGTVLYWRVTAFTPDGRRLDSASYRVVVR